MAKEDYILPDAHTVDVSLSPEQVAAAGTGDCEWSWQARRPDSPVETRKQPCKAKFVIKRVPYSLDRNLSGVSVKVKLPNGAELADPSVIVEDLFVVAMGDSFASGESNPDRPVTFSATRQMVYDPVNLQANQNLASRGNAGLPRRLGGRSVQPQGAAEAADGGRAERAGLRPEHARNFSMLSSRRARSGLARIAIARSMVIRSASAWGWRSRIGTAPSLSSAWHAPDADIVEGLFSTERRAR